tara:strand:+ start:3688 stop:4629 length:942 start_codon:yes stop_codon:yes gene_type:complete
MGPTSTLPVRDFTSKTLPENSIEAIKHAIDIGADGVEIDVHLTKDNKIAVIHDDSLNKKVFKADRIGQDLGRVCEHNMKDLKQYDIGNGHKIPSLVEVLDFIVKENKKRILQEKPRIIINIELKGRDVVDQTFSEISEYLKSGELKIEDFIFNSFDWDKLKQIRQYSPEFKVVPAIKTIDLFGPENVEMPGFKVTKDAQYTEEAFSALQKLHDDINCYAFDCIVFDLRPEFVEFCEKNKIGLLTSTSKELVKAEKVKSRLALMMQAASKLPMVCFRADNTSETLSILKSIANNTSKPKSNDNNATKKHNKYKK